MYILNSWFVGESENAKVLCLNLAEKIIGICDMKEKGMRIGVIYMALHVKHIKLVSH